MQSKIASIFGGHLSGNECVSIQDLERITILAVIDIGGNSMKLELRRASEPNKKPKNLRGNIKHTYKSMCQLAKGIGINGQISSESKKCVLDNLEQYKATLTKLKAQGYNIVLDVVGTAPFRDAERGLKIAEEISKESGFDIRVLSETEEALLTAGGIYNYYADDKGKCNISGLTCDLGGGSAEFTIIKNGKVIKLDDGSPAARSLPIGLQRIAALKTEEEKRAFINQYLDTLPAEFFQQEFFFPMGGAHRDLTKAYARIHNVNLKERGKDSFVLSKEFIGFSQLSSEMLQNGKTEDLRTNLKMKEQRIPHLSDSHLLLSMIQERAQNMATIALNDATMRDAIRAKQRAKLHDGYCKPSAESILATKESEVLTAQI